jgi:hypothetical protein
MIKANSPKKLMKACLRAGHKNDQLVPVCTASRDGGPITFYLAKPSPVTGTFPLTYVGCTRRQYASMEVLQPFIDELNEYMKNRYGSQKSGT